MVTESNRTSNQKLPVTSYHLKQLREDGYTWVAEEIERLTAHVSELEISNGEKAEALQDLTAQHHQEVCAHHKTLTSRQKKVAECNRLRAALVKYGRHKLVCAYARAQNTLTIEVPCDCGFEEALDQQPVETSRCSKHGTVFDNPEMGCPRCAAENGSA